MIEKRQTNLRFLDAWNIQKIVLFFQSKPLQDKSTKPTKARSIRSAWILVRSLTPPHPPQCRRTVWKLSVSGNDSGPIKGGHLMGSSFKGGNLREARHVWPPALEYLPRFYVNCILISFLWEPVLIVFWRLRSKDLQQSALSCKLSKPSCSKYVLCVFIFVRVFVFVSVIMINLFSFVFANLKDSSKNTLCHFKRRPKPD